MASRFKHINFMGAPFLELQYLMPTLPVYEWLKDNPAPLPKSKRRRRKATGVNYRAVRIKGGGGARAPRPGDQPAQRRVRQWEKIAARRGYSINDVRKHETWRPFPHD